MPSGNIVSSALSSVIPIQSAEIDVTGQSITLTLSNSTAIYAWAEVDDSETSTWTEVDDSATMTWQDAA